MPYIKQDQRAALDEAIATLALAIKCVTTPDDYEGVLNYALTRLVTDTMPGMRYRHVARVTGVLENVKQEFYRRLAAPYEDRAAASNGDIDAYGDITHV